MRNIDEMEFRRIVNAVAANAYALGREQASVSLFLENPFVFWLQAQTAIFEAILAWNTIPLPVNLSASRALAQ